MASHRPRIFEFDHRRVILEHYSSSLDYGHHRVDVTVCDRGECTLYAVVIESDLFGSLSPLELARAVLERVDGSVGGVSVIKRFKETP